jgi:hypothetical protein
LTNKDEVYVTKDRTSETLDVIFSNDIIFMLYNLYYISKIENLKIRVGPIYKPRQREYYFCITKTAFKKPQMELGLQAAF